VAYPSRISFILGNLHYTKPVSGNAVGSDANFGCGSFVRFHLQIDETQKTVSHASFSSNGCGYMLAASEILAREVSGKKLADLHGLDRHVLTDLTVSMIGEIAPERGNCVVAATAALANAFADFRSRQIEEFRGEQVLMCTCFGVTEESIVEAIQTGRLGTVDQVANTTNAGSGCGSCRMLIQEMLDNTDGA